MQLILQENGSEILEPHSYPRPLLGFAFTNTDTQVYYNKPLQFLLTTEEKKFQHESADVQLLCSGRRSQYSEDNHIRTWKQKLFISE